MSSPGQAAAALAQVAKNATLRMDDTNVGMGVARCNTETYIADVGGCDTCPYAINGEWGCRERFEVSGEAAREKDA